MIIKLNSLLVVIYLLVGVVAMALGMVAILNSISPLGCSVEWLEGSPFTNFLIPGVILFSLFGLGNLLGSFFYFLKCKSHLYVGSVLGCGLVIFIVVQCLILRMINPLHVIFFGIGWVQASCSSWFLVTEQLFPTRLIIKYLGLLKQRLGES